MRCMVLKLLGLVLGFGLAKPGHNVNAMEMQMGVMLPQVAFAICHIAMTHVLLLLADCSGVLGDSLLIWRSAG